VLTFSPIVVVLTADFLEYQKQVIDGMTVATGQEDDSRSPWPWFGFPEKAAIN
jgi:hypothetical protein